jgi:DNA replication factor GINS
LEGSFYRDAASYLRTLRDQLKTSEESSPMRSLLLAELHVSERLLEELLDGRHTKIVRSLETEAEILSDHLTAEERGLTRNLSDFSADFLRLKKTLQEGELEEPPKTELPEVGGEIAEEVPMVVVRLMRDLPAIVGVDLETYGPFKAEDIASLPEANATPLISQGAARRIMVRPSDTSPK